MDTDKFEHGFVEVYDLLFASFGGLGRVLEVGTSTGSQRLLKNWFMEVVTLDLPLEHPDCGRKPDVKATWECDQGDRKQLAALFPNVGELEVVIDDGSHVAHDQQITMSALLSAVRPGGLYVIEDLHAHMAEDTLRMVERYIETGVIEAAHLSETECSAIQTQVKSCYLFGHPQPAGSPYLSSVLAVFKR
jgi:hypothetical protein